MFPFPSLRSMVERLGAAWSVKPAEEGCVLEEIEDWRGGGPFGRRPRPSRSSNIPDERSSCCKKRAEKDGTKRGVGFWG